MNKNALSLEVWCQREEKPELLALYDEAANGLSAAEVPFSCARRFCFRCRVCGNAWRQTTNLFNRLCAGEYNVITKRPERTFCPYCRGERISARYNLATEHPEVRRWWDPERNARAPETYSPDTHAKFYLRCPQCRYPLPRAIRIGDRKGQLRCPRCGDGKQQEVTADNCLKALYPQVAAELDESRNQGITGENILPSYNGKLWFRCPRGHRYQAKVSNRTYLGRGCGVCARRRKTSFAEQAISFYLRKCCTDLCSGQADPHTGREVDILLPSRKTIVEFNSLYCHTTARQGGRLDADLAKLRLLTRYYRVYVIVEEGSVLPVSEHPLLRVRTVPIFSMTEQVCRQYDRMIGQLLREIFPEQSFYPNVDILRDQLLILQQYVNTEIEDSFEVHEPLLAADWHPTRNGSLTPGMFRPTVSYKFYWVCRSCGHTYRMSMGNRRKVNPDTCPYCCRKSRYPHPLLCETYPFLKLYWCAALNAVPFSEMAVASEREGIFELADGRVVAVRICNLSGWLYAHPGEKVETYFERCWQRAMEM